MLVKHEFILYLPKYVKPGAYSLKRKMITKVLIIQDISNEYKEFK
jgi:hypothetical protein